LHGFDVRSVLAESPFQPKEAFAPGHRTLEPPLVPGPCLWNFGPPLLEEGSRFAAPLRTITPRDPRAVEGLSVHDVYGPPEPGSTEQVYFYELHAQSGRGSETLAMLRNQGRNKAVVLRFHKDQLPCFTLWKNTAGPRDGYVTGLEPATNYPNPRPFEKARNRIVTLPVDGRYVVETTLEVLATANAVAAVESEKARNRIVTLPVEGRYVVETTLEVLATATAVAAVESKIEVLQSQGQPTINPGPREPFAADG